MFNELTLFTFGICFGWLLFRNKRETLISIEKLKNALLSHMLMKVGDIEYNNYEYHKFDGSKLPIFSGYNISNACFSYIFDINEFKNNMFYSSVMESKLFAINKYIEKNLNTDNKVLLYFEKYLDKN